MTDFTGFAVPRREGAFYVFDIGYLEGRLRALREALPDGVALCYAVKANPFLAREIAPRVERFEICSPGEWRVCQAAGLPSRQAVISGVYKPEAFIRALVADPGFEGMLTVESARQYRQIVRAAGDFKRRVPLLLRLTNGSQFGLDREELMGIVAERHPLADIVGVQFFSGTQKTSVKKLARELEALDALAERLRDELGFEVRELEYGPGLPARAFAEDEFDADAVLQGLSGLLAGMRFKGALALELGRGIAAGCGRYYTHVVDCKRCKGQNYAITDGGMHQLVYFGQSMAMKHPCFSLLGRESEQPSEEWNICGALCSMNDLLVKQAALPPLRPGDTLCFENAGAYCVTEGMSLFLSRDLPAVYLLRPDGTLLPARETTETAPLNTPRY